MLNPSSSASLEGTPRIAVKTKFPDFALGHSNPVARSLGGGGNYEYLKQDISPVRVLAATEAGC